MLIFDWKNAVVLLLLITNGCGTNVETGVVTGVVTKNDKPLERVMVYFMPDPTQGTEGNHSIAVTDANGRYSLAYTGKPPTDGAAIGWHKVTLEDMIPENYRGKDAPPESRIPDVMVDAWNSPLKFEVKPGEQEIDIKIPADE